MKHTFLFLTLFLLGFCVGNAQETLEHTVSKGETVFQLSRKYNVSPQDIYDLNPSSIDVIKIGEVLLIPKNSEDDTSESPSSNNPSDTGSLTYAVVSGDTKFSLAKKYRISVAELERQNPHIKTGLQAGHILKIKSPNIDSSPSANFSIVTTHLVLKGQTLWGISKNNGLTVDQLVNANADILNGILQTGQLLKIPKFKEDPNNSANNKYLVQRGDTKYGLSKKYDVSIKTLENANPQIVRMLMAGQTISIPQSSITVTEPQDSLTPPAEDSDRVAETPVQEVIVQEPNTQQTDTTATVNDPIAATVDRNNADKTYSNYEIQAKETLYGLSKKASMRISDFITLNPQLKDGVQVGMRIKMPNDNTTQPQENQDAVIKKPSGSIVDLTQSIKTTKKNQVLLFLPFSKVQYDDEYAQNVDFNNISDGFLKEHLEFYRGAKIAEDSARALGLDFNIKIVTTNDSKRNNNALNLVKDNSPELYDAMLLPYYEDEAEPIADLVKDKNIPIISAATAIQSIGLQNIYNGVPTLNAQREVMLDYMLSQNANIIVVSDVSRKESRSFIARYAPNAKFVEVSKRGTFNADDFVAQLESGRENFVILESDKNSVFIGTTNILLGQLSNFKIHLALLDNALIPNTDEISKKRFVILEMVFPSLTPLTSTTFTTNFINAYKKSYGIEPTQNVKIGFDLTYDTLLRLSQEKNFTATSETDITAYTNLRFHYKSNQNGGHDNYGIYVMQYNSDGSLKEIE